MPPPSFEFGLVSLFYLGVKIGCLFELSLKRMHYQLYISLLVMFLQNPIHFGMFCLYFDLSPGIF